MSKENASQELTNKLLRNAIPCKDLNEIIRIIQLGVSINCTDFNGFTPLHLACQHCLPNVTKFLLSKGADVNSQNKRGETPLHYAIPSKDKETIRFLLDNGADISIKDSYGSSPLHLSCYYSMPELTEYFYRNGIDINGRNKEGNTPLHNAVLSKNVETITILISLGADLNVKNKNQQTPLHTALSNEIYYLCNYRFRENEIVKLLVTSGCLVDVRDSEGRTPLALAVKGNSYSTVDLLLQHGAQVNQDQIGCISYICDDVLTALLEEYTEELGLTFVGSSCNLTCGAQTAMIYANSHRSKKIVTSLLKLKCARLVHRSFEVPESFKELISIQNKVFEEVKRMVAIKIENFSLLDVVKKRGNQLAVVARNKAVIDAFSRMNLKGEFPIFCGIIKRRLKLSAVRLNLNENFISLMNEVYDGLPFLCSEKILSYLTADDLRMFIYALKSSIQL